MGSLMAGSAILIAACGSAASSTRLSTSETHRGVTIRLSIDKNREVAGTAIRGLLVVVNRTGHSITVRSCPADGTFEVGLGDEQIPFEPVNGAVACTTVLRRGVTRIPVELSTLYEGCGVTGQPRCRKGREPVPPLPAGQYLTSVDLAGMPRAVEPTPLVVTVLAPASS